ncbi:MAG: hypothetical protein AAFR07_05775 [Pseudomonadota bacterium]
MSDRDALHMVIAVICLIIAFCTGWLLGFEKSGYRVVIPTVQVVTDPVSRCNWLVVRGELRPPGGNLANGCTYYREANRAE